MNLRDMKLGKLPPRYDRRTLKVARYLTPALPSAPAEVDYSKGVTDWGMMLNDSLGCCTIAAVGHAIQCWTVNADSRCDFSDDAVRLYYEKWDGYDPKDPSTDGGGVMLDVLRDWRRDTFAGRSLDAYISVPVANQEETKQALWIFGGLYIGVELPITAQNQDIWYLKDGPDAEPGSWGGHCINLIGYDETGLTCVTWGAPKKMTWEWYAKYCSEAFACVSKSWIESSGVSPSGFDLATLEADLKLVTA